MANKTGSGPSDKEARKHARLRKGEYLTQDKSDPVSLDTDLSKHDSNQGARHGQGGKRMRPATSECAAEGADLPERWSALRKTEFVMRLLRGEALDAVSRDSAVLGHELEGWRRVLLEHALLGSGAR